MKFRPKVLIVDDEANIRRALSRVFNTRSYQTTTVPSGSQALSALAQDDFNLVISDLKMPGMNGIDLLSLVRERYPLTSQILLSGNADIDDLDSAIGTCNINYYISKPWSNTDLIAKVDSVIGDNLVQRQKQTETDHMQDELLAATGMQQSLLPDPIAASGLYVESLYKACVKLGGDAFNYELRDQKLHFYMIDVVGHGAAAAMESFALQHLLARADFSEPDRVTARMNSNYMYLRNPMRYFTMLSGTLDVDTGLLRFCQAGHPSPLVVKSDQSVEVLGSGGFPVGMIAGARYEVTETKLNEDDLLMMFSDGLAEQGCDSLRSCITSANGLDPKATIDQIKSWRLSAPIDDDVSALFLRRQMNTTLEIDSKLELVHETVEQLLSVCRVDVSMRESAELCLNEVLNNAIVHGNASDPKKRIRIHVLEQQGRLLFRITDESRGLADNALDIAKLPDVTATSGRGLALIKALLPDSRIDDGDTVLVV